MRSRISISAKNASLSLLPAANMETYPGSGNDDFLARRGALREPLAGFRLPRVILGLIDSELDNLIREAFHCDDADDTFRGMLRAAMDRIQPNNVLTSLCAYHIGFEGDPRAEPTTELTLLATVLPSSLTRSEAIRAIGELLAVLQR